MRPGNWTFRTYIRIVFYKLFYYVGLAFFPEICYYLFMTTKHRLYSIDELVTEIYEDNLSHFDFDDNMGGEPCKCDIHTTIRTIVKYWENNA